MALFDFRKSAAPVAPVPEPPSDTPVPPMEDLLRLVLDEGASDLHLSVGTSPVLRRQGRLVKLTTRPGGHRKPGSSHHQRREFCPRQ